MKGSLVGAQGAADRIVALQRTTAVNHADEAINQFSRIATGAHPLDNGGALGLVTGEEPAHLHLGRRSVPELVLLVKQAQAVGIGRWHLRLQRVLQAPRKLHLPQSLQLALQTLVVGEREPRGFERNQHAPPDLAPQYLRDGP